MLVLIELLSEDQPSGNEYRDKRMHNILVKVRMLVSCVLNRILDSHIFLIGFCEELLEDAGMQSRSA